MNDTINGMNESQNHDDENNSYTKEHRLSMLHLCEILQWAKLFYGRKKIRTGLMAHQEGGHKTDWKGTCVNIPGADGDAQHLDMGVNGKGECVCQNASKGTRNITHHTVCKVYLIREQ